MGRKDSDGEWKRASWRRWQLSPEVSLVGEDGVRSRQLGSDSHGVRGLHMGLSTGIMVSISGYHALSPCGETTGALTSLAPAHYPQGCQRGVARPSQGCQGCLLNSPTMFPRSWRPPLTTPTWCCRSIMPAWQLMISTPSESGLPRWLRGLVRSSSPPHRALCVYEGVLGALHASCFPSLQV